ncbi:Protein RER1 [Wickerhamiella sorbophila]|uniref:Protein RER1 n=1 Tax=Wickerhamiella sorbophila TaxID=45607 RepID=A0A2T0FHN7_9ASCO|nr:Protein RER1 [Wickerhamiella sorbophila]PRT54513.1 Protein RER1 [Wickerhamiella sorbophila]
MPTFNPLYDAAIPRLEAVADLAMDKVQQGISQVREFGTGYQFYLDKIVPHVRARWFVLVALIELFMLRILLSRGWYIVCYGLGIYLLNLFLAFLTPKFDPSLEDDLRSTEEEEGTLPNNESDEFRPFIRRLPEFNFWYNAIRATVISLVLTCFSFTDLPVFWPILLVYFIILFILTMRRQIQHMVRYRYLPFNIGKKKFTNST